MGDGQIRARLREQGLPTLRNPPTERDLERVRLAEIKRLRKGARLMGGA